MFPVGRGEEFPTVRYKPGMCKLHAKSILFRVCSFQRTDGHEHRLGSLMGRFRTGGRGSGFGTPRRGLLPPPCPKPDLIFSFPGPGVQGLPGLPAAYTVPPGESGEPRCYRGDPLLPPPPIRSSFFSILATPPYL